MESGASLLRKVPLLKEHNLEESNKRKIVYQGSDLLAFDWCSTRFEHISTEQGYQRWMKSSYTDVAICQWDG